MVASSEWRVASSDSPLFAIRYSPFASDRSSDVSRFDEGGSPSPLEVGEGRYEIWGQPIAWWRRCNVGETNLIAQIPFECSSITDLRNKLFCPLGSLLHLTII